MAVQNDGEIFTLISNAIGELNKEYKEKQGDDLDDETRGLMMTRVMNSIHDTELDTIIKIKNFIKIQNEFKMLFNTAPEIYKCKLHEFLEPLFVNKNILADNNCLFHAIAYWVNFYNGTNIDHIQVRKDICDFLCNQSDYEILVRQGVIINDPLKYDGTPYDNYICNMRKLGVWGGEPEIEAAAMHYNMNIILYKIDGMEAMDINSELPNKAYLYNCAQSLGYGIHYEVLIPINEKQLHQMSGGGSIKNLAKLYDRNLVYGLKNLAKLI